MQPVRLFEYFAEVWKQSFDLLDDNGGYEKTASLRALAVPVWQSIKLIPTQVLAHHVVALLPQLIFSHCLKMQKR